MHIARIARHMDPDDIDMELSEIDKRILEILEEGRCTRQHLAERLDVTGQYIYQRVDILLKLGVVEKIHDGFYELAAEHREDTDKPDTAIEIGPEHVTPGQGSIDRKLKEKIPDSIPENKDASKALAAIAAAEELVHERGGAQKKEFVLEIMPDHSVGYDVEKAIADVTDEDKEYKGSWWRAIIRPGLELSEQVEKPEQGGSVWKPR